MELFGAFLSNFWERTRCHNQEINFISCSAFLINAILADSTPHAVLQYAVVPVFIYRLPSNLQRTSKIQRMSGKEKGTPDV